MQLHYSILMDFFFSGGILWEIICPSLWLTVISLSLLTALLVGPFVEDDKESYSTLSLWSLSAFSVTNSI